MSSKGGKENDTIIKRIRKKNELLSGCNEEKQDWQSEEDSATDDYDDYDANQYDYFPDFNEDGQIYTGFND